MIMVLVMLLWLFSIHFDHYMDIKFALTLPGFTFMNFINHVPVASKME